MDDVGRRTIRSVTRRLIPFLFVLYVVAYLDRVNFGYAALQMNSALGISAGVFGVLSGIFFIGYLVFEIPSNLVLQRVGARIWIARIMVTWGVVEVVTAFATNATELAALRFLLGIAEAGFFPGLILYLTGWFRRRELASTVALFMTALAVSNIVGAPVSTWILDHVSWFGLSGWRWLFIIEGLPAVILGIVAWLYLTDRPAEATWLSVEEKAWLRSELEREEDECRQRGALTDIRPVMTGRDAWHLALVYCLVIIGLYGTGFWMPQIIRSLDPGFSNFSVGLLMIVPFLAALIAMIAWGRHSDRTGERRWHTALPALAGGIALIAAMFTAQPAVVFLLLVVATVGIFCTFGPFWTLPLKVFSCTAAAVGIALINSVGNLGGFIGPSVMGYIALVTGSVQGGLPVVGICLVLAGILSVLIRDKGDEDVPA